MLLLLLTWAALGASANTLILTTADTYGVSNLLKEFDNPGSPGGAPGRVMQGALSSANGISAATFADAPGPYDLVVVYSVYSTVDATNWAVLQDALQEPQLAGLDKSKVQPKALLTQLAHPLSHEATTHSP